MASSKPGEGFDEVLYSKLQCRAVSPWGRKLECLDVLTKKVVDKGGFLPRLRLGTRSSSSSLKPSSVLVNQGSMFDPELMSLGSKWRDADLGPLHRGVADLQNLRMIPSVRDSNFEKKRLVRLQLAWNTSRGASAWLMDIAGMDLGTEETLVCTVDGLVAAWVDFAAVRKWVSTADAQGAYDWCPNVPKLRLSSSDWSKDGSVKSLWIVTDVLHATKLTVTGRNGLFASAKAQVATGVPGLNASANISLHKTDDNEMVVKAPRNAHFIVGYRVMRLDYNVRDGGKLEAVRAPEEAAAVRGHDDDYQMNLEAMKEDIFEVDEEDGELVPVLLSPLSEQELDDLNLEHSRSGT